MFMEHEGCEFEEGDEHHAALLEGPKAHVAYHQARLDAAEAERAATIEQVRAEMAELDRALARLDAEEVQRKRRAREKKERFDADQRERLRVYLRCATIWDGARLDMIEQAIDDDELTARDVMCSVIRTDAVHADFDDEGRSDEYVRARFDSVCRAKRAEKRAAFGRVYGCDGVVGVLHGKPGYGIPIPSERNEPR